MEVRARQCLLFFFSLMCFWKCFYPTIFLFYVCLANFAGSELSGINYVCVCVAGTAQDYR